MQQHPRNKRVIMKSKIGLVLFLVCAMNMLVLAQTDSTRALSFPAFLTLVKKNHPVAKQAELLLKSAKAAEQAARGSFDPKLFYDFNGKFFDDKNYYELGEGGFSVATNIGLELKAGYEQNSGIYLNPENTTPANGLVYTKFSMPFLQGLIIDERRAILKQAKIFNELSEVERLAVLNELMYNAGKAYWDWQLAYLNLRVFNEAVQTAQQRFEGVKKSWSFGDRPAIDTVEALIQLQDRIINFQQGRLEFITKGLMLSNFLWMENNVPVIITEKTIPEKYVENGELGLNLSKRVKQLDSLVNNHPELRVYEFKLKQLQVDRRLKQDKLKPRLNVNYNPLYNPENLSAGFLNNYKYGVSLGFPLFLRKERGELAMARIKIDQLNFETGNKRNELLNKTKVSVNEFNNLANQIAIYDKNVLNYERLWDSEKRLFEQGESSLFMMNSREMSMINARLKLNEMINKNQKAMLEAQYSFGLLNSLYE